MAGLVLRPRSSPELVDAAFDFVRANYGALVAAVALSQMPWAIVSLLLPPTPLDDPFQQWRVRPELMTALSALGVWWWAVTGIMFCCLCGDLITGRPANLADSLRRGLARGLPGTTAIIVKYVVIILWAMLFVIPAVFAFARYFAVIPALALEGLGPLAAVSRSKQLARGANPRIIAIVGVPVLIYFVIISILQQIILSLALSQHFLQLVGTVVGVLVYPFVAVLGILAYYDLRIRREGLDLELEPSPPASAA